MSAKNTQKAKPPAPDMEDEEEEVEEPQKGDKEEEKEDLRDPNVVTKYRLAGEIANGALALVIKNAEPGKKLVDLCALGDKHVTDETGKIYKQGKIERGVAFPTCISVNNIVGHVSPLANDPRELKENDVVKVDLGAHIDGYIAVVAHTFVVNGGKKVTGKAADVIAAAATAQEAALKLLKAGNKNTQVTPIIGKVCAEFKVNPVQGVLSHQMKRFVIDGEKVIINKEDAENKVDPITFEQNEVYAVDVVVSTGDGKPKESEERVTVFKRKGDVTYKLKLSASKKVLGEIDKRFPTCPFTVRALEDKTALFGVKECVDHELLQPFQVMHEKAGDIVAHFKFTALLLASGTVKITGLPVDPRQLEPTHQITDPEIKAVLQMSSSGAAAKKKKKKKPAAKGAGGAAAPAAAGAKADKDEDDDTEMS